MNRERQAITAEQALAAMAAVEDETLSRCRGVVDAYIARKSKKADTSRIAAARVQAAREIAEMISKLPRKSREDGNAKS